MSDEAKAKRKPGRLPKIEGDLKNTSLTFRTRAGMREKLEAEAALHHRSISEEVEARIQASFEAPALEALLRRVISEEIEKRWWVEIGYPDAPAAHSDDALAVMAEAQH
jgi:hypothetical protein